MEATRANADELKAGRTFEVVCKSGRSYLMRRVKASDYIGAIGGIPGVLTAKQEAAIAEAAARSVLSANDARENLRAFENLVSLSLAEPALGDGDGQIHIEDVPGDDLVELGLAVMRECGPARARPTQAAASN